MFPSSLNKLKCEVIPGSLQGSVSKAAETSTSARCEFLKTSSQDYSMAHVQCILIYTVHVCTCTCVYMYMCVQCTCIYCVHVCMFSPFPFLPLHFAVTLSSSLLPLRGHDGGAQALAAVPVAHKVWEFPPLKAFEPNAHYPSHLSFTHHLYLYPASLKYNSKVLHKGLQ